MQLVDLSLKGARHHAFAQSFDTVHLGFHQASPVVANPVLPNTAAQPFAHCNSCIAMPKHSTLANSSILAGRNDWNSTMHSHRFVDGLCVLGTIASKTLERFICWQLRKQIRHYRSITDVITCYADSPNLQGIRINTYVQLAPLMAVFSTVFFYTSTHLHPGT